MSTSMNQQQKGTSLKGQSESFSGSDDISVWIYHMNALLGAMDHFNCIAGQVGSKPRGWSQKDLNKRVEAVKKTTKSKQIDCY